MKSVTYKDIKLQMLSIFKDSVGIENAIGRKELYRLIYGYKYIDNADNKLKMYYLNSVIHWFRKYTKCFVCPIRDGNEWKYFVISDKDELQIYLDMTDNYITGLKKLQKRAKESIKQEWFKDNWSNNKLLQ